MIVWLASYPRSGNTFFRVLLNSIFDIKTYSIYGDKLDIGADKATSDVVGHAFLPQDFDLQKLREEKTTYYIKTHDLPDQKISPEDKIIYLIRDGRESTLSYKKYTDTFVRSDKSLIDVITGDVNFGSWGDHVKAWDPTNRPNTLLIKFEELTQDPTSQLASISKFLDVKPTSNTIPTFEELQKINPKFFRSGKKDSWKEVYTDDELNLFWAKHYLQMKKYGYKNNISSSNIQSNLKISVITPTLNAGNYIERAIQSVLDQEYSNFEHIIVDAQSTDNTIDILKKYPHLKWISEQDSGQSNAMNKGFKLSTGDIIVYLNHDDYFVPNAFNKVIPYFEKGKQFVIGNVLVIDTNNREVVVKPKIEYKDILHHWNKREYLNKNTAISSFPNNPVQYFYTREVQEKVPFNEKNHFTMDIEFLMDTSALYQFYKIDTILGVYFRREDAKAVVASNNFIKYWTFDTFSYIDKHIQNWDIEKVLEFKKSQANGYLNNILDKTTNRLINQERTIQNREETIKGKEFLIDKMKNEISNYQKTIQNREETIKGKEFLIDKMKKQINQLQTIIKGSESLIKKQKNIIDNIENYLYLLLNSIEGITSKPILSNPMEKYNAYKKMLKTFDKIKGYLQK